jgi:hypothetical protein
MIRDRWLREFWVIFKQYLLVAAVVGAFGLIAAFIKFGGGH